MRRVGLSRQFDLCMPHEVDSPVFYRHDAHSIADGHAQGSSNRSGNHFASGAPFQFAGFWRVRPEGREISLLLISAWPTRVPGLTVRIPLATVWLRMAINRQRRLTKERRHPPVFQCRTASRNLANAVLTFNAGAGQELVVRLVALRRARHLTRNKGHSRSAAEERGDNIRGRRTDAGGSDVHRFPGFP